MHQRITRCNGKHIIIGEAASAHHAWVVGSLESAVRGVYQFLFNHTKNNAAAVRALEAYDAGVIEGLYGPLLADYDRTQDICLPPGVEEPDGDKAQAMAPVGDLARLQVLVEMIRLEQELDRFEAERMTSEQKEFAKSMIGVGA